VFPPPEEWFIGVAVSAAQCLDDCADVGVVYDFGSVETVLCCVAEPKLALVYVYVSAL
jgi:hypothetical protein